MEPVWIDKMLQASCAYFVARKTMLEITIELIRMMHENGRTMDEITRWLKADPFALAGCPLPQDILDEALQRFAS